MRNSRLLRHFGAAALLALLAGCASGPRLLRTDVTTFNDWATLPASRTYVFSRTLEYQNSLEVKAYEDVVRDELALKGFTLVGEPQAAGLIVTLRPTVTSARLRVREAWPDPFFDDFGGFYGGYYGRGLGWRGAGWNPGWYGAGFGPYGGFGAYSIQLYQRRLEMDIDSRTEPGKRYYEGRVENSGPAESMTVAPYLVRALFADFPGNNGQTRRVDVPLPPRSPAS